MEKWDIMNSQGEPTGNVIIRGRAPLKSNEYHLVVHIWIISEEGNFLIQRRSNLKKLMPGEWAATGGSAISGESSFCAAQRELLEELGIMCKPRLLKKMARIKKRNSFVDVWFIKSNVKVEDLVLQRSEVSKAKWVSEAELRRMISSGQYHNYGTEYFDLIFKSAQEYLDEFKN